MVGREAQHNQVRRHTRRGSAMVYVVITLLPLMALATLDVDFGRVQTAKEELQAATDAAARYAAAGLTSTMQGNSGATANAVASFADNHADGQSITFNPATDLETGIWVAALRTFTPATVAGGANAVRITTKMTLGNPAHPLTFLGIFGRTVQVTARSVAMVSGNDASTLVTAKGNPWLAGMGLGAVSTDFRASPLEWDFAGGAPNVASSPALVGLGGVNAAAGSSITFDGVTGGTDYTGTGVNTDADGTIGSSVNLGSSTLNGYDNYTSSMNGMSNCHAPINAMMAVFLSDADPSLTPAPVPLDFSTAASRDFVSLTPLLKQVFFVGDGRRANGEVQQFVVPPGATRLFIANMDGWQYNNNLGGYNLTIHATHKVVSVSLR